MELEITLDYFFEVELCLIQSLNYSETYFELDSEEATNYHHCHLISCVYIKGYVSIQRIKAMHVCVKMMLKGSKEALTVLIVTHVTQVERVESGICGSYTTLYTE